MSRDAWVPELEGGSQSDSGLNAAKRRASISRSILWAFASSMDVRVFRGLKHADIAYTFAVCMLEVEQMARGKGAAVNGTSATVLPKFVDVKLTPEQKADFIAKPLTPDQLVQGLSLLCDDGYRVGCSWSGEHQTYTVSLTCRDDKSVNAGLCMTSFARDLPTAVALALYKHSVVTGENWLGEAGAGSEDFG